jgi:hypothetical protein
VSTVGSCRLQRGGRGGGKQQPSCRQDVQSACKPRGELQGFNALSIVHKHLIVAFASLGVERVHLHRCITAPCRCCRGSGALMPRFARAAEKPAEVATVEWRHAPMTRPRLAECRADIAQPAIAMASNSMCFCCALTNCVRVSRCTPRLVSGMRDLHKLGNEAQPRGAAKPRICAWQQCGQSNE